MRFRGPEEKAAWLDGQASLDTRLPRVRELARRLRLGAARAGAPGTRPFFHQLAIDLHRFCRDSIHYRGDRTHLFRSGIVTKEEFADAETILGRGYDDCDGKARCFVAVGRAAGLECRIQPVFNRSRGFVHVQAECRWPGSEREPLAERGGWILAELILRDCQLGQDPDTVPRNPVTGRRPLTP